VAIPYAPLFVAPRVMPQGTPNVLGNLIAGWDQGQQVFQQNQANDLARQYADLQLGQGQQGSEGPTLGNLVVQPQAYSGTAPITPVERGGALPPVGPSVGSAMPSEAGYSLGGQVGAPIPTGVGFAAQPGFDAITYDYGPNTVRNQPVNPQLATALNNAARIAGVDQIVIGSGGQPGIGQGGNRTGSTRHDHGNAADLRLVVGGRELDFTNPADQAVFSAFVEAARAQGITGIGAGTDYMGNNTIHMGYGPEAVWGAGGQGENAPPWLREAYGAIGAVNQMAAAPSGQAQRQAYASGASPTPFTPAMASILSQMAANPNTREFAFQEIARLTQAATVEYGFQEVGGVLYATNPRTGQASPVAVTPAAPDRNLTTVDGMIYDEDTGQWIIPPQQENEQYRPLVTPEERLAYGIPPTDTAAYQVGPGNQLYRVTGGGTTVNTYVGPEGDTVPAGFRPVDNAFAPEYQAWVTGGFADVNRQVQQLDQALAELRADPNLTGPLVGMAPDWALVWANPAAIDVRDRVQDIIQRNLRLILGAQFTQREGEALIQRAYNPSLPVEQNIARIQALVSAMKAAAAAKQQAVDYFGQNGTLWGYTGQLPTLDPFIDIIDGGTAPAGGNDPLGIR
jgi:hypothetical protein